MDLSKEKSAYAHFFLNSDLARNFYDFNGALPEQADYARFLFRCYVEKQTLYREDASDNDRGTKKSRPEIQSMDGCRV